MAFWHHVALKQHRERVAIVVNAVWNTLIGAIHTSGRQAAIAITGGGSGAIGRLLAVPGGSRSVLEAVVPYSAPALIDFLHGPPDQFCSARTARAMAMAAWSRARTLATDTDPYLLIGVGMTASLVSTAPKRGNHRIHVGVQTAQSTYTVSLTLTKALRTRRQEERIAEQLLLVSLGEACGADATAGYAGLENKLHPPETIVRHTQVAQAQWTRLLLGKTKCVCDPSTTPPAIIFPGAFNPLHHGHVRMAQIAEELLPGEVAYELSITNVDKPPIDFVELCERLRLIREQDPRRPVLLTAAPTFCEKADVVPGSTFVVGIDTVMRIADPKYYGGDPHQRDVAIAELARAGCRLLVFGRRVGKRFASLSDVKVPAELRAICTEVPADQFHEDVSSREIRQSE